MTDIIVSVLQFLQGIVTDVLPDLSLGDAAVSAIKSGLTTVTEFMAVSGFVIPLPTVFTIVGLVFGFRLAKFGVFLVNWVIRRIADLIP